MAHNESAANHDMSAAYGRYADERARWVQVLGRPSGARPVRKPAKQSAIARLLALFDL
ncbi:hypothetical protein Acf1_00002 [Acidovorax phage ACF1]|nr:hypothetical protein Acf1_00002 [Acidovorax phage ACF1]